MRAQDLRCAPPPRGCQLHPMFAIQGDFQTESRIAWTRWSRQELRNQRIDGEIESGWAGCEDAPPQAAHGGATARPANHHRR